MEIMFNPDAAEAAMRFIGIFIVLGVLTVVAMYAFAIYERIKG